jgi:putative ABC transport system permease protein
MASVTGLLLLILAVVAIIAAVLALRNRVPFRIAMRNVRRGRWRSVLIVLGLLVGTAIISGSLVINDTVATVNVHYAYQAWGYTTEAVYNSSVAQGSAPYGFFPIATYNSISTASASQSLIAGTTPEVIDTGSAYDTTTGVPQSGVDLIGVNSNQSSHLGAFTYDNGTTTVGPAPGTVLLDDQLASDLGASVGNRVVLYGATSVPLVVQGIVQDDTRGGFFGGTNAFVTLATGQALANESGRINFIAITNVGSLTETASHTGAVMTFLNTTLASLGHPDGLTANALLQDALNRAITAGTSDGTLFLVLGLFSIAAGALLIVGIFVTLAEERKGEMGMLRAVGLSRGSLVYVYFFEGLVYAAIAALVGTVLGLFVGYVLVLLAAKTILSTSPTVAAAFIQSFTVTGQSLAIAFVSGFLLTVVTIAAASGRVSRLNIVRAIRSVPEPPPTRRAYTLLAYLGVLSVVLGALLFIGTRTGTGDVSPPLIGFALVILGAGMVASRFVRNRYAFSAVGLLLIVWAGSVQFHEALIGHSHSGSIFAVFVEGILMVFGAVLLFIFNSDLLVAGIARLAGRRGKAVGVTRVGLSYPRRRAARSAVNFAIFAMIIFTVVIVAADGASVSAALANSVQAESGGYTFAAFSTTSIPDLPGQIANNSTLRAEISLAVPVATGTVFAYLPTYGEYTDTVYAAPLGQPASGNFYTTNQYNFSKTWHDISTAAVWQQLETNASVAIVDGSYAPAQAGIGSSGHPTVSLGGQVALANPATRAVENVTVIAYMSQTFLSGFWINPTTADHLGYDNTQGALFTVAPGASVSTASQDLKRAFFPYGLTLYNFAQILQNAIQTTEGAIGLLEVFVALGLAVGIAGMGIFSLRAVTERRTQIGMLRASGFTRGMIFASFLLEYSYVTLLGTAVGTGLALWLYWNATQVNTGGSFGVFTIPTATILAIVLVAYGLTVLAIFGPSWRAANLPPAEAVRYTE